ncbi:MAG: glucosaminidase domain-containing protein [Treponema sp.]|jgi:hypothetical protein|nr:glucosaminidase domain-containing protein [Treponema sp.]
MFPRKSHHFSLIAGMLIVFAGCSTLPEDTEIPPPAEQAAAAGQTDSAKKPPHEAPGKAPGRAQTGEVSDRVSGAGTAPGGAPTVGTSSGETTPSEAGTEIAGLRSADLLSGGAPGGTLPGGRAGIPGKSERASVHDTVFPGEEPFSGELILPEYRTGAAIMGKGKTGVAELSSFLLSVNKNADPEFIRELSAYYIEEAEIEGINHDVAFAQMCLETGFLQFGGLVTPDMNNFCGLGSIGPGIPGERFPSPRTGVRAHIQHLKAYASDIPLAGELVDPRYRWVRRGSAPVVALLAGTWAADTKYADKIEDILQRLLAFSGGHRDERPEINH